MRRWPARARTCFLDNVSSPSGLRRCNVQERASTSIKPSRSAGNSNLAREAGLSDAVRCASFHLSLGDPVNLAPSHAQLLHRVGLSGGLEVGVEPLIDACFRNRRHGMAESVIQQSQRGDWGVKPIDGKCGGDEGPAWITVSRIATNQ